MGSAVQHSVHRREVSLSIFILLFASGMIYAQLSSSEGPPYAPGFARLTGSSHKLSPEQFTGPLSEYDRKRIEGEAKTNGFSHTTLNGAKLCGECHQDVVNQWSVSAHRFSSFNNPFYEAAVEDLRKQEEGKTRSRWCASCHDPSLLLTGDFDTDFDRNAAQAQAGLSCFVCHGIRGVYGRPGNGNYVMGPGLLNAGDPFLEPDARTHLTDPKAVAQHKQNVLSPTHRSAEFCGSCHKASLPTEVNNYRWFRAQNDYDPWHDSGISGNAARTFFVPPNSRNCQDCHMSREKAVMGDLAAKNGMVKSHRFLAVNTALPALRKDKDTINRIKEFLSGRVSIDIAAIRKGADFQQYFSLPSVTKPGLGSGEEAEVDVVIRNHNVGHTFPGGTLDINEGWLEATLIGPNDELIAASGNLKRDGSVDPQSHSYCALFLDQTGKPLIRHNVADIRTLVWRHVIQFGESDLVRYRFTVPRDLVGKTITLRVRLLFRKFNEPFRQFALQANPKGFRSGDIPLPIIELASTKISLMVTPPRTGSSEYPLDSADANQWERLNDYGIAALLQRDFETAKFAFGWIQKVAPNRMEGDLNLIRTMIEEGNTDEALKLLSGIKDRLPENPLIPWLFGQSYYMRRQYSLAATSFQDVVRLRPGDRQSWMMLGRSLADSHEYETSVSAFDEVLKIDGANAWAYYIKGRALEELNRNSGADQAMAAYERYRDDYSSWNRAWSYREKSEIDNQEGYPIHWHYLRYLKKH